MHLIVIPDNLADNLVLQQVNSECLKLEKHWFTMKNTLGANVTTTHYL